MTDGPKNSGRRYRSDKRAAARAVTGRRIVEAAEAVLAEKGWPDFTMAAVAERAGVTRLTVYNQFGQRRDLLEALFDARSRRGGFGDIPTAMSDKDPHAAVERIAAIFCRFWQSGGRAIGGVFAESMADPEFASIMAERNERRRRIFSTLVDRMVGAGDVDAAHAAALVDTLFALTSYVFFAELTSSRVSPEEAERIVIGLARQAITASAPASSS